MPSERSIVGTMNLRFVHVPRTGGVSIRVAWDLQAPEYRKHRAAIIPGEPVPDFTYGFVRNPFDRVVSIYHRTRDHATMSFREWAISRRDRVRTEAEMTKPIDWLRPCYWWLRGATFVGRFENREEHLRILATALGRPYPDRHDGATEREPYQAYHDAETRAWVEREYRADIEAYGYRYEPLPTTVTVLR